MGLGRGAQAHPQGNVERGSNGQAAVWFHTEAHLPITGRLARLLVVIEALHTCLYSG